MDEAELKVEIRRRARDLGFDTVGFTTAKTVEADETRLTESLALGHHGSMDWLARDPERRTSPHGLWQDARCVIALGTNYGPAQSPLAALEVKTEGAVSVYAQGKDYHDLLKKRLKALARWLHQETGAALKVFVDTAPVMEKPLAQRAGLGWQGKHTNLVSRDFGSWLLLAEIYLALDLDPDESETDHCGQCQRCLDICPTKAFTAPYQLDARRCISYLTIEHKGQIPAEFRAAIGNRIYGCDDCLAVCPWNKFAKATQEPAFLPRAVLSPAKLADLARLNDAQFRAAFAGSPVKRIGRDRFVRNVLIAVGNSDTPELAEVALDLLCDPAPIVRGMAIWALSKLSPDLWATRRESMVACETDAIVLSEWESALNAPEAHPVTA